MLVIYGERFLAHCLTSDTIMKPVTWVPCESMNFWIHPCSLWWSCSTYWCKITRIYSGLFGRSRILQSVCWFYKGLLKSSWTGCSMPLLCRGRH